MSKWKIGAAIVAIAWFAGIASIIFWNVAPADNFLGASTAATHSSGILSSSIGSKRQAMLESATRLYVEQTSDAATLVVDGKQLAPAEFLNGELERQGEKWRVRGVDGMTADTYDIS